MTRTVLIAFRKRERERMYSVGAANVDEARNGKNTSVRKEDEEKEPSRKWV